MNQEQNQNVGYNSNIQSSNDSYSNQQVNSSGFQEYPSQGNMQQPLATQSNNKGKRKKVIILIGIFIIFLICVSIFLASNRIGNKINTKRNDCHYDGELKFLTEYINGQYTYTYTIDSWAVKLTDKKSTDPVTTKLCTHINDYPITSMESMFAGSQATSIDLSSFNTSNVTRMFQMFSNIEATNLDLSGFDTSNVKGMEHMFWGFKGTALDLSSFDTSNVEAMSYMFSHSKVETLDLSNFSFSNVTKMNGIFSTNFDLKTVYVKNQTEKDILSQTSGIPSKIEFVIKK